MSTVLSIYIKNLAMNISKKLLIVNVAFFASIQVYGQDSLAPDFYGRININAEMEDPANGDSSTDIVSNASRLGVRGGTEINDGLELIYQLEYEVNPDDGDSNGRTLKQRNSYLGFRGSYGTILAGRHDTPAKMAQNRIDLFNDMIGDIKNVLDGENRVDDIIMYTTPNNSGFSASLATIAGGDDENFTNSISASVSYENESFYASLGLDSEVKNKAVVRFVTQFYLGNLTLGALFQESEDTQDPLADDEDGSFVSAAYKIDQYTLKIQFGESDQKALGKEQLSAGFDYKLGDNTKLFTYYTHFDADNAVIEADHYGVGFEHRF